MLALTADAMPIDVERGKQAGFVDYLIKPIQTERLIEAVNDALKIDTIPKQA